MANKYGIYQSSNKSCVFYKLDEDGNQSTFNLFVKPDKKGREEIMAFIDNEQIKKDNWSKSNVEDVKDIMDAFGGWASDAPIVFELEAQRSLGQCLSSASKKKEE